MQRFSERIGVNVPAKTLQIDEMSKELKNSLWNLIYELYESEHGEYWRPVALYIAQHFRKTPVDEIPYRDYECRSWVKTYIYSLNWHQVYDLMEFIVNNHLAMTAKESYGGRNYLYHSVKQDVLLKRLNRIFEIELSGFRFVAGILTPISDKVEQAEIEEATIRSQKHGLTGPHEHIHTALKLLGKKPEPDYRNAIKEAISAVESVAKLISGSSSSGLDGAIEKLSKRTDVHGALKEGFKKLYGYTSDEDGIRHSILDQPRVGFVEAKYMIVSCSAFINYVISKADEAGLFKK